MSHSRAACRFFSAQNCSLVIEDPFQDWLPHEVRGIIYGANLSLTGAFARIIQDKILF
jgi:hypothetical protein